MPGCSVEDVKYENKKIVLVLSSGKEVKFCFTNCLINLALQIVLKHY